MAISVGCQIIKVDSEGRRNAVSHRVGSLNLERLKILPRGQRLLFYLNRQASVPNKAWYFKQILIDMARSVKMN